MRRLLTLLFGLAISAALLFYLVKDIDFALFQREFHRLRLWVALPLFLIFLATLYLRGLRWKLLLPAQYRAGLRLRDLVDASTIGFAASSVLPLRAGEVIRPLFLRRLSGVPFTAGFASIFTERVFDLTALLIVAYLALTRVESAPQFMITTARALGTIAFVGVLGLLACALAGPWTLRLAERIVPKVVPGKLSAKLLELLRQVVGVLSALRSASEIALVIVYSLAIWLGFALYYQLSLQLFGEAVSFHAGLLLASTIAFAVAAPSSPGFLGTYQFGCALTLTSIYGYPDEFSLAYGLTVHLVQTVSLLLYTAFVLWRRGIGLSAISTVAVPGEAAPAAGT